MKQDILDKTFGVRLLYFLQDLFPATAEWDACNQEEYMYLCIMACRYIKEQFKNYPEDNDYFQNLVPGCESPEEFIKSWFTNSGFYNYLVNTKSI